MSEAYLKVDLIGSDGECADISFTTYDGKRTFTTTVKDSQVVDCLCDKESIQNELLDSLRYVANFMFEKERESVFNASSVYGVVCSCDAQKIIDGVRKVRDYPASGKIYSQKRGGEDVLCMVLGVDKDWVCYTDKRRKAYRTTVDFFMRNWTYTGEGKENEIDDIYNALEREDFQ